MANKMPDAPLTKPKMTDEELDEAILFDDAYMRPNFEHDPRNVQTVLEAVLDHKIPELQQVETEKYVRNEEGRSVRFDVFSDDKENTLYVVEVQRITKKDLEGNRSGRRFSKQTLINRGMHDLYMLGTMALKPNETYTAQREHYVIFILDEDLFERDKPQYKMLFTFEDEDDRDLGTGTGHLIFVNGAKRDENTILGRLMIDFATVRPEDMHPGSFKDTGMYFKRTPEGRAELTGSLTLRMEQEHKQGFDEGKKEGRLETILGLVADGDLTPERGAAKLKMTTTDFEKAMTKFQVSPS